jgi:hypothetical protein
LRTFIGSFEVKETVSPWEKQDEELSIGKMTAKENILSARQSTVMKSNNDVHGTIHSFNSERSNSRSFSKLELNAILK